MPPASSLPSVLAKESDFFMIAEREISEDPPEAFVIVVVISAVADVEDAFTAASTMPAKPPVLDALEIISETVLFRAGVEAPSVVEGRRVAEPEASSLLMSDRA